MKEEKHHNPEVVVRLDMDFAYPWDGIADYVLYLFVRGNIGCLQWFSLLILVALAID